MTAADGRRWRGLAGLAAGAILALVVPAIALAHPLGNFTVNHYAGLRIEPDRVIVDVVIDRAEIPTFQEKLRIDTDGDGVVSDAEAEAERVAACPRLAPFLHLSVAGADLVLVPVEAGLSFPPGAAGLDTMRLVCIYAAALPQPLAAATPVAFHDDFEAGRLGWHEIVVTGSGVTPNRGSLPASSVSDRLRTYPANLIAHPLAIKTAAFTVTPGGPILAPFSVPDAGPLPGAPPLDPSAAAPGESVGSVGVADPAQSPGAGIAAGPGATASPGQAIGAVGPGSTGGSSGTSQPAGAGQATGAVPGGVAADVAGILETRDLSVLALAASLLAAMALGAGHALTPGHGKTLMGAYLVGTKGTARHAVALGLSVTVSHTVGILVLAAVVIGLRGVVAPELFNRVAPVVSGLLVLGIGAWLLGGQLRQRLAARPSGADTPAGAHDHPHHGHEHYGNGEDHEHHGQDFDHGHGHEGTPDSTDGAGHDSQRALGWRSLFVLGLAGGIIPSTNALIILLATVATGRALYGLVLVVAFGLGMAVVLGGVGLGLVFARDRLDRLPSRSSLGRLGTMAPLMAGVVVLLLGFWLTGQALVAPPTL